MGGWITVHSVLMVVTGLVFGYAVVRAGVLPRWNGALLMLGMLSMVVATALPDVVQTGAAALRDIAFAGMGAALLGIGRRQCS
jgi:ethanolamine utilization microcompartment shell protein EutS